jgi:hypothetical protein
MLKPIAIPMLIPINNVTYFIMHTGMYERTINMQLLLLLALDIQDHI